MRLLLALALFAALACGGPPAGKTIYRGGSRALLPFEEDLEGSLEPGKLADLVILGRSPLAEPAESLAAVPVLEAIVGGESVWRAP
jgi:predicted amidohydrolase YtcJ